jgi:uncharacterized membrane protein
MKLEFLKGTIEGFSSYIEFIAILLISITSTIIILNIIFYFFRKNEAVFELWKKRSWRGIQGGLDLLVATDLISTLTIDRDFNSVLTLGVLLLIRIMISWSLQVEVEGCWPWKKKEYELTKNNLK